MRLWRYKIVLTLNDISQSLQRIHNVTPLCSSMFGHFPILYLYGEKTGLFEIKSAKLKYGINNIAGAIFDNKDSTNGIFFCKNKIYINSPLNIDTNVHIEYKKIKNMEYNSKLKMCTLYMIDNAAYRLTSDIWNQSAIISFLDAMK